MAYLSAVNISECRRVHVLILLTIIYIASHHDYQGSAILFHLFISMCMICSG